MSHEPERQLTPPVLLVRANGRKTLIDAEVLRCEVKCAWCGEATLETVSDFVHTHRHFCCEPCNKDWHDAKDWS